MKHLFLVLFIALTFFGCKNDKSKAKDTLYDIEETIVEQQAPEPEVSMGCYVYSKGDNHVTFEVTSIENDSVIGKITYAYAEKDANDGTFRGVLNADKLIGNYTFTSEGVESTREVAFMVKGAFLEEGYGPMNETGTAFKDRDSISYTSKKPLAKTSCK